VLLGDAPRHLMAALTAFEAFRWAEPLAAFGGGYYPPGVSAVAALVFAVLGPSASSFHATMAVCTALGAAGAAALAWRVGGRAAAPVAASAWAYHPEAWPRFTETQLDWPVAGAAAWALAGLPAMDGRGPVRIGRALAGGTLMGVALLVKQVMVAPFFAVGLLLLLLALPRPGARRPRPRPAELGAWLLGAALVAAPWYLRSLHHLTISAGNAGIGHAIPAGVDPWVWRASLLGWLKLEGTMPAVSWALLLALVLSPWLLRRRPAGLACGAAALGGLSLLLTFPDPHERHFVAIWAPMLALAVAPLGALGDGGAGRRGVGLLVSAGLSAALLGWTADWRRPWLPEAWPQLRPGGWEFGQDYPHGDAQKLGWQLIAHPGGIRLRPPRPGGLRWPLAELAAALAAAAPPGPTGCSPRVQVSGQGSVGDALRAELMVQGVRHIEVSDRHGSGRSPQDLAVQARRCGDVVGFVAVETAPGAAAAPAAGLRAVGAWPVIGRGGRIEGEVTLWGP